jgi:hypothetical protein
MEMSAQLHDPAALAPGKEPWYTLDRRLGGLQSQSGHGGEKKNSQPLPGLEPPIIQHVAQRYTAELSRLLFKSYINFTMNFFLRKSVGSNRASRKVGIRPYIGPMRTETEFVI